jgi:hypothetical protein
MMAEDTLEQNKEEGRSIKSKKKCLLRQKINGRIVLLGRMF